MLAFAALECVCYVCAIVFAIWVNSDVWSFVRLYLCVCLLNLDGLQNCNMIGSMPRSCVHLPPLCLAICCLLGCKQASTLQPLPLQGIKTVRQQPLPRPRTAENSSFGYSRWWQLDDRQMAVESRPEGIQRTPFLGKETLRPQWTSNRIARYTKDR